MTKPIDLTLSFSIPKGRKLAKAAIQPDGEIVLTDDKGNTIVPKHMERITHYARDKGPKIQSRSKVEDSHLSIGGVKDYTHYDSVFVIDTNTRIINGDKISAACFMCCNFITENDETHVECEGKLNIYEFHNIPENENPEMLAILKVARDVIKSSSSNKGLNAAFVTDSNLDSHDHISKGKIPIYKNHLLPSGFTLHYASADTGSEAINRLIRLCDKQASNYLKYLEEGTVKQSELLKLKEEPTVQYRYLFREDLELVNPQIKGMTARAGAEVSLYGVK